MVSRVGSLPAAGEGIKARAALHCSPVDTRNAEAQQPTWQLQAGRGGPAHRSSGGGRRSRWSSLTYTWQVEHAREASQAPGDSK